MMFAPPPPPPPPQQPTGMPPSMPAVPLATAMLPPPPPPAEPMPTFSSNQQHPPTAGMPPSIFLGPPPPSPSSGLFTSTQPNLPLPEKFDASRPPPPLPNLKRRLDSSEAGPSNSKTRKEDLPDSLCENCIQRELRIDVYKSQMYKLHCEDENQRLIYKQMLEEYEHGRDFLRSMVGPELFRLFDDYIEGTPQTQQIDFMSGMSTVPRKLLLQLVKYVATKEAETNPSALVGMDTNLLQNLIRRPNSFRPPSPDRVHTSVLKMICNSSTTMESSSSGHVNGVSRSTNGQHTSSPPGGSGSGSGGGVGGAGPSGRFPPPPSSAPRPFVPPALSMPPPPHYYPGGPPPPPARPYYPPQPYGGPPTNPPFPNVGYNSGRNAPGSQMTMRPPASVAHNYNNYLPRYQSQYYPPYQ